MPVALAAFLDWIRSRLWFIPGMFAAAAVAGAFVLVALTRPRAADRA